MPATQEEEAGGRRSGGAEIPFWIFGQQKWVSGIGRSTTCHEVIRALFRNLGEEGRCQDPGQFVLVEKWRKIERPLAGSRRIVRVWEAWGEDKTEVRFVVRRQDKQLLQLPPPTAIAPEGLRQQENPSKSSTAAVVGAEICQKMARHKQLALPHRKEETTQRRYCDDSGGGGSDPQRRRRTRQHHSQRLCQTRRLDTVHPRRLYYDENDMCKDSIQRLMKIIITQGNTIQSQLLGLREREMAIDSFEHKMHLLRMKESGKDYVLQTYLDQLPPADGGGGIEGGDGLSVSPRATRGQGADGGGGNGGKSVVVGKVPADQVQVMSRWLEKLAKINSQLMRREEEIRQLVEKTTTTRCGSSRAHVLEAAAGPQPEPELAGQLEAILRMPLAALEAELRLSRSEFGRLVETIAETMSESQRIERELTAIEERKLAGDIYIRNLMADLDTAEAEGTELQKEFTWILSLPPSAFASQEMLDWLRKDVAAAGSDTDSELGLDLSSSLEGSGGHRSGGILLPDQMHPAVGDTSGAQTVAKTVTAATVPTSSTTGDGAIRSSSTGSTTSSGVSSDLHSSMSPEPPPDDVDEQQHMRSKMVLPHHHHHQEHHKYKQPRVSSESPPQLPPRPRRLLLLPPGGKSGNLFSKDDGSDSNSDTGLSSLNSSSEADQFTLDTLV